ncbi:GntR family transcriptional regulator, partial [Streptococcus uberis]|uniref:GntR family transcriptional regulator n=1 Tax=Streptococcus uberis TaxID=1349 RepID=UPI003D6A4648
MVPTSEPRRRGAQSKADTAYAHIKEQIERGAFEPYQRVLAAPIAAELGVSGVPVREAIQRLEARGLLYRRQGGGTYVQNALSKGIADPLFELLSTHPEAQYHLL